MRAWGGRDTQGRLPEGRRHDGRTHISQQSAQDTGAVCQPRHETFTVRAARSSWLRTTRPTTSRSDGRTLAARTQSRNPGERRAVGEQVGGTCRASIRVHVTHNFNSLRRRPPFSPFLIFFIMGQAGAVPIGCFDSPCYRTPDR